MSNTDAELADYEAQVAELRTAQAHLARVLAIVTLLNGGDLIVPVEALESLPASAELNQGTTADGHLVFNVQVPAPDASGEYVTLRPAPVSNALPTTRDGRHLSLADARARRTAAGIILP